jgi:hypothetical protein
LPKEKSLAHYRIDAKVHADFGRICIIVPHDCYFSRLRWDLTGTAVHSGGYYPAGTPHGISAVRAAAGIRDRISADHGNNRIAEGGRRTQGYNLGIYGWRRSRLAEGCARKN